MAERGEGTGEPAAAALSGPAVSADAGLAVLFRQVQWALDDAAHEWPAGRVTPRGRAELAGILESLAVIVRASIPAEVSTNPEP